MFPNYDHRKIEQKWREKWEEEQLYRVGEDGEVPKEKRRYVLDMFPYPSAAGLHVGHPEGYSATDIYVRYLRMKGFHVLHPMGWDAFGLPAENYAIKQGVHPRISTWKNSDNFRRQIKSIGFSYDWSREINTADPRYYKWTQWFFLLLYKNGLAYRKKAPVNWCTSCQTVLAREQVIDGRCERCKSEVVQKELEQWFFKITDYAERLLSDLDKIDWPEPIKLMQRNWIGRSGGAEIVFEIKVKTTAQKLKVFTTRADTLFGATYIVVAPEHPILKNYELRITNYEDVQTYVEESKKKTELERTDLAKEKTGVELQGIKAVHPATGELLPVWVADYVVISYGTGAIMAVPAHDSRDFEFAKKYGLEMRRVIAPKIKDPEKKSESFKESSGAVLNSHLWQGAKSILQRQKDVKYQNGAAPAPGFAPSDSSLPEVSQHYAADFNATPEGVYQMGQYPVKEVYTGDGLLTNSEQFNGLSSQLAREQITAWLQEKGLGSPSIQYKLRDWLISRQRYWGAPIPIIYCASCGEIPVSEESLPVLLPEDVDFKPTGESPLTRSESFHNVSCPKCKNPARRESDTMDTFVCSSWYLYRYTDPHNDKAFASKESMRYWLPVDMYVGGAEHAVMHLLYARFFCKVLYDLGYIDFDEPFKKLINQGLILAEDGRKMSKSWGNVINPDDVIDEYGADALRMYEMFMGPLEDAKPWSTQGIKGIKRFLEKVWFLMQKSKIKNQNDTVKIKNYEIPARRLLHKTIKKVTEDIEAFKFNTAIAQLMIFANELLKNKDALSSNYQLPTTHYLLLLAPFAPHIAEELWHMQGNNESIFKERWPGYDEKILREETVTVVIQINGKRRGEVVVERGSDSETVLDKARNVGQVRKYIEGKEVKKNIYVQDKIVNFVI